MWFRYRLLLLLCFGLSVVMMGCGQSAEPTIATVVVVVQVTAEPTPLPTPPPATATPLPTDTPFPTPTRDPNAPSFEFAAHHGGQPALQWHKANWQTFIADYPDLYVRPVNPYDYYGAYVNRRIFSQLERTTRPDVFSAAMGGHLRTYAAQGVLADISDLWQEEGWDEAFPASVKAMATVNGRQYFVPQAIQWNAIFYRSDVLASAGLTPPTTWQELIDACDTLNAQGITPFAMTATSGWPPPMGFWFTHINQRLNGPAFHEALMRGQESYTDPRVVAVFEHYGQLFEHNCFDDESTSRSYSDAIGQFESGNAAMYAHGEWLFEFIDEETQAVTELIRFPLIDASQPLGELVPMWGAFMLAEADFPEVGREFLRFVGNEASQQTIVETIGRLPSNLNVDRSTLGPVYEDGLRLVSEAETLTQLIGANTHPDVANQLLEAIGRFWHDPSNIDAQLEKVEAQRLDAFGALSE